jgi:hypothetical protein
VIQEEMDLVTLRDEFASIHVVGAWTGEAIGEDPKRTDAMLI